MGGFHLMVIWDELLRNHMETWGKSNDLAWFNYEKDGTMMNNDWTWVSQPPIYIGNPTIIGRFLPNLWCTGYFDVLTCAATQCSMMRFCCDKEPHHATPIRTSDKDPLLAAQSIMCWWQACTHGRVRQSCSRSDCTQLRPVAEENRDRSTKTMVTYACGRGGQHLLRNWSIVNCLAVCIYLFHPLQNIHDDSQWQTARHGILLTEIIYQCIQLSAHSLLVSACWFNLMC